MLTYACVHKPEDIMRKHECFTSFSNARWEPDIVLVYENEKLILILNNRSIFEHWMKRNRRTPTGFPRMMERYIRLRLKLRARHKRLRRMVLK